MSTEEIPGGELVLYTAPDGRTRIECRFSDQTLWMSQAMIADLFQTTPQNITLHLKAIFAEGELTEEATCKDYLQVRSDALAADYQPSAPETADFFRVIQNKLHFAATGLTAPELNRIVVMWLDFAEDQARRRQQVFLQDWETRLDDFLRFNDRRVLQNAGRFSAADAKSHAEAEYERFAELRRRMLEAEGEAANIKALEDTAKRQS